MSRLCGLYVASSLIPRTMQGRGVDTICPNARASGLMHPDPYINLESSLWLVCCNFLETPTDARSSGGPCNQVEALASRWYIAKFFRSIP